jgi:2'-5' RNA ligase
MARSYPGQLSLFDDQGPAGPTAVVPPPVIAKVAEAPPLRVLGDDPVFFAIMLGGKVAGDVAAAGQQLRSYYRLTSLLRTGPTLHVSVLGAGIADDLTPEDFALIVEAGSAVTMPRFDLSFVEAFSFRRAGAKPLVLPCDEGAEEVAALAEALWAQMRERGFTLKGKLDAAYHLTLAYDRVLVPKTPLEQPIRMPVKEFALVRSYRGDGRYDTIKRWTLAG